MKILGIETSCDETAAAVLIDNTIKANVIAVQAIHQKYGGVVPEFASREHMRLLLPVIQTALETAGLEKHQLDGIAVTYGPGLAGSLLIGLNVAKALALSLSIPWIAVNHIEGHILSNLVGKASFTFPFLCLVVSGGHTQLVLVSEPGQYQVLGRTRDDAVGEAYDKVARILDLGYPGGPLIDKIARQASATGTIRFPRAYLEPDSFDFSFSGLKTAVLYYVRKLTPAALEQQIPEIAAEFQAAVVEVLVNKTLAAAEKYHIQQLAIAGGVARNSELRKQFTFRCQQNGFQVSIPDPELCTDNAAMIAQAGHFRLLAGEHSDLSVGPRASLAL